MATLQRSSDSFIAYDVGDVIADKYRLQRKLGQGGVGTVWLARNLILDAPVAIKLIRPGLDLPDAADRLLKEARAEAKLEHRAIVRVFDFGETSHGEPFIVMELLEGQDLGELLDESERLAPTKAVQILLPVIEALDTAHAHGIVHRDLKPENIFIAKDGKHVQPKIVDFGIAKLTQSEAVSILTRAGVVLGTPAYMAPEQARGEDDVDHRVDTWAICVVLYECIVGERPFGGDNYNAILRAVIEDDVAPIADHGVSEPELWSILQTGLKKERSRRWQSMRQLGTTLAAWLLRRGVTEDVAGEPLADAWQCDAAVAQALLRTSAIVVRGEDLRESEPARPVEVKSVNDSSWRRRRIGGVYFVLFLAVGLVIWLAVPGEERPDQSLIKLGRLTIPEYLDERAEIPSAPHPAPVASLVQVAVTASASAQPARQSAHAAKARKAAPEAREQEPQPPSPAPAASTPVLDLKEPY